MGRNQLIAWLLVLALTDVLIPFPILAIFLIWVVVRRPPWFREQVRALYGSD